MAGVAGEQYALPEAVEALRRPRPGEEWVVVSAADPLNLEGILDDRPRVPAVRGNRLLYRCGKVAAVLQGGVVSWREPLPETFRAKAERALLLQFPSLRDSLLAELPGLAAGA